MRGRRENRLPASNQASEQALLRRLRAGDGAAFTEMVDDLHAPLIGLARTFTSSPSLAEDIVQETWLAVIRGLAGFEGRSTLRTWIFGILIRRARTVTRREARRAEAQAPRRNAAAEEWRPGFGRIGLWKETPIPWGLDDPADLYQSREALEVVRAALDALPAPQRRAVLLRDVEDVPPAEICNILCVSETNLRVLLHRGRARIRQAIDQHLRAEARGAGAPPANAARRKAAPPARAGSPPNGGNP